MIEVIYNEGLGFTELRRVYNSIPEALAVEGELLKGGGKIYQNGRRLL